MNLIFNGHQIPCKWNLVFLVSLLFLLLIWGIVDGLKVKKDQWYDEED